MNHHDLESAKNADISARVGAFYEQHPYPLPVDDLDAYRSLWDDRRRRADAHLLWPAQPYRDDRSILVAGCGTTQAAHYAVRWPRAKVVGIDLSSQSISLSRELQRKYALENLALRVLDIEHVAELGQTFDYVVCTGVLHHLPDPDAGLRALHDVLNPAGALHLMVYAPYGRAGIYMLQEYCRRLGVIATDDEIHDLAATLRALPAGHPLAPLLRNSPDFSDAAGLADALLHPQDRSYSVPQVLDFVERADLVFGRWLRQAAYLPACGAIASTPHRSRLTAMPREGQFAEMELFRGTMVRHNVVAFRRDRPAGPTIDFGGENWLHYVPVPLPDTIVVRERVPAGASAVLINRNHIDNDLYFPIDERKERLHAEIDGKRSIAQICELGFDRQLAHEFFEQLWSWDQIVFDLTAPAGKSASVAKR